MEPDQRVQRCNRPCAFDKMEALVRLMQDPKNGGVPVRKQKILLTSVHDAFMAYEFKGYDMIEWLMDRLAIEESGELEALNLANQLCQYGYFFPINDSKNLVVKDDSTLYRFQSPYYWPAQKGTPDRMDYAVYLVKRTLRNKQRHGLEDYEQEQLNNLKYNLANKWEFITMQAEEQVSKASSSKSKEKKNSWQMRVFQVKLAKSLKKTEKGIADSQERAFWRVLRPPPGMTSSLEPCPVPMRNWDRQSRKRTVENLKREVDFLKKSLTRTRIKMSQALESMVQYVDTYSEYDAMISPAQPSNPWVTEDSTFWMLNSPLVEVATEKRVKRWGLSMEELVSDPTGIQEFTIYLSKEFSHENIRFWMAVNDLRRSAQSQVPEKVRQIFDEFLKPGAQCEINIDGKTMEKIHQEMQNPSRFTFDAAQDHIYTLLLKKDCYPRFIRSDYYKNLLANGKQPSQKKRFFGFGPTKKKSSTTASQNQNLLQQQTSQGAACCSTALTKRRGSDRSLSGSAHELAVSGIKDSKVPHSHSQSNLSDIPYRGDLANLPKGVSAAPKVPSPVKKPAAGTSTSEEVCPWETESPRSRKNSAQSESSSSEMSAAVAEISEKVHRTNILTQQHTVDGGKRLVVNVAPDLPRRASVSVPIAYSSDPSTKRKVSSFEDGAGASFVVPTGDPDNKVEHHTPTPASCKTLKKSHSVAKTCAAPIISVSSAADDQAEGQEVEKLLEETPVVFQQVEPLAPLAEPDSESPASELPPSEVAEEVAVAAAVGDDAEARSNDVCPWEDEEACKVDTPFVKTYATLGYL
ncbi:regulator of G-protein signaling 7 isoform X5 [Harmonia axyridis]|uniref:regulator of G-protein signaling 7 isoform X5 n=1 Tax=Harmonia axyridis TaxID=115357 RepID=UPI001E277EC7|nr:regulator of G-protein signaling 7 isoform X5 [Harmonia axyridis]